MTNEKFQSKINSIETLRHYIDVEISTTSVLLWIIILMLAESYALQLLAVFFMIGNTYTAIKYIKAIRES